MCIVVNCSSRSRQHAGHWKFACRAPSIVQVRKEELAGIFDLLDKDGSAEIDYKDPRPNPSAPYTDQASHTSKSSSSTYLGASLRCHAQES